MLPPIEQVSPAAVNFSGNATGIITFTITSPPHLGANSSSPQTSKVTVPLKVLIQPTPPRSERVIWDVLHSIKYPPGYVPRDNLDIKVRWRGTWTLLLQLLLRSSHTRVRSLLLSGGDSSTCLAGSRTPLRAVQCSALLVHAVS